MKKEIICIECPNGCVLSIDIENDKVISVNGNKCEKGKQYAIDETENPVRNLASTVLAEGLSVRMVSVKTDKPIPKNRLLEAMGIIKKVKLTTSVAVGDVIVENFLEKGINLISTRNVK